MPCYVWRRKKLRNTSCNESKQKNAGKIVGTINSTEIPTVNHYVSWAWPRGGQRGAEAGRAGLTLRLNCFLEIASISRMNCDRWHRSWIVALVLVRGLKRRVNIQLATPCSVPLLMPRAIVPFTIRRNREEGNEWKPTEWISSMCILPISRDRSLQLLLIYVKYIIHKIFINTITNGRLLGFPVFGFKDLSTLLSQLEKYFFGISLLLRNILFESIEEIHELEQENKIRRISWWIQGTTLQFQQWEGI